MIFSPVIFYKLDKRCFMHREERNYLMGVVDR